MHRPFASRSLLLLLLACGATGMPACRCDKDAPTEQRSPSATSAATDGASPEPDESKGELPATEGGARFRDAAPAVAVDPDGPVDPACTGATITFATAIIDARCAIGSARAKALRASLERDAGPLTLAQDAQVTSDGKVLLRLVNTGPASLALPLSFHAKLPAFSALAEDEHHAIYELEPPHLEVGVARALDGGAGYGGKPGATTSDTETGERAHFARVVLPPGGVALAMLTISPNVARVIGRRGAEVDAGVITRLPRGRYILHVGELLTDVEAGPPARVTWSLP